MLPVRRLLTIIALIRFNRNFAFEFLPHESRPYAIFDEFRFFLLLSVQTSPLNQFQFTAYDRSNTKYRWQTTNVNMQLYNVKEAFFPMGTCRFEVVIWNVFFQIVISMFFKFKFVALLNEILKKIRSNYGIFEINSTKYQFVLVFRIDVRIFQSYGEKNVLHSFRAQWYCLKRMVFCLRSDIDRNRVTSVWLSISCCLSSFIDQLKPKTKSNDVSIAQMAMVLISCGVCSSTNFNCGYFGLSGRMWNRI